nr:MAG TPA: hypothetical protein [Caudoviricetes sp.]
MPGRSIRTSHYFYGQLGFFSRHGARNSIL